MESSTESANIYRIQTNEQLNYIIKFLNINRIGCFYIKKILSNLKVCSL